MPTLGFEGSLTINGVTPGFTNLRFGFGHTEVDATTQLDGGNKAYAKGLQDKYIAADMNIDESPACATVMAAVQSRDPVPCSATMNNGSNPVSISGNMLVFGGEVSTGLDEVPKMAVTCRPAPASSSSSQTTNQTQGGG